MKSSNLESYNREVEIINSGNVSAKADLKRQ